MRNNIAVQTPPFATQRERIMCDSLALTGNKGDFRLLTARGFGIEALALVLKVPVAIAREGTQAVPLGDIVSK